MNADRNEELGGDDIHVFFCPPKLRIRYIIMLTAGVKLKFYLPGCHSTWKLMSLCMYLWNKPQNRAGRWHKHYAVVKDTGGAT